MLVRLAGAGDVLDEDGVGRGQLLGVGEVVGWRCGDDFADEAGLFADFSQRGLDGVFVGLDVAAGGHPLLQALVPVQERGTVADDEGGGGEVADVGHDEMRIQ